MHGRVVRSRRSRRAHHLTPRVPNARLKNWANAASMSSWGQGSAAAQGVDRAMRGSPRATGPAASTAASPHCCSHAGAPPRSPMPASRSRRTCPTSARATCSEWEGGGHACMRLQAALPADGPATALPRTAHTHLLHPLLRVARQLRLAAARRLRPAAPQVRVHVVPKRGPAAAAARRRRAGGSQVGATLGAVRWEGAVRARLVCPSTVVPPPHLSNAPSRHSTFRR